jgi:hypothetical protein
MPVLSSLSSPPLVAALFTGAITICVFVIHARRKERTAAMIGMFKDFMTNETLLRSRLITQEYLVPGVDRSKFPKYYDKTFDEINELLENSIDEADKEARFSIRAIPSFFLMVNEAATHGYIPKTKLFSRVYSYYFVMVIEPRRGQIDDPLYRRFDWMMTQADESERRKEYAQKLAAVAVKSQNKNEQTAKQAEPPS